METPNKMIGGALAGITGGLTNVLGATEESKGSDIQNQAAQAAALTRRNLGGVASTMGPGLFGGALAGASGMSEAVAPEASQADPAMIGVGYKGSGRVVGQNDMENANQITDLSGQATQPIPEPQMPAADLSTMTAQERYYNKYA